MKDKCLHCAQCCYITFRDKNDNPLPTDIPCPYLKDNLCLVYDKRFKVDVGKGNKCSPRKDSHFDYEGCPYNVGKPMVKDHKLI